MSQITDQTSEVAFRLPKTPIRVFAGVAAHFVETRPEDPLFAEDLLVAVGAEAYILCGRSITGGSADLVAAALERLPVPYVGITRGEFALVLLREVNRSGEMWAEGDNARVIPSIPGQRVPAKVPTQPKPEQSTASTCCGRAMRRDGTQWVCGKCKGWNDTGRTALTLAPALVEGATA